MHTAGETEYVVQLYNMVETSCDGQNFIHTEGYSDE